jgi:hypothetical protein
MDGLSIPERMEPLSRIEGTTARDQGDSGKQRQRRPPADAEVDAEEKEQHDLDELA